MSKTAQVFKPFLPLQLLSWLGQGVPEFIQSSAAEANIVHSISENHVYWPALTTLICAKAAPSSKFETGSAPQFL